MALWLAVPVSGAVLRPAAAAPLLDGPGPRAPVALAVPYPAGAPGVALGAAAGAAAGAQGPPGRPGPAARPPPRPAAPPPP
ncbi:hypothetical protein ACFV4M_40440, partial [Kitasatospora indigofera]|uniref:hypothetical protein n=1 Tax=Kitasatospora indigofera TaxID=67307 RepID=UPI003662AA1A